MTAGARPLLSRWRIVCPHERHDRGRNGRNLDVPGGARFRCSTASIVTIPMPATRAGEAMEYGDITLYLLPAGGMCVRLATKRNDWGIPVELTGLPIDCSIDPATPLAQVASGFDPLHAAAFSARPPR
jgi:hypothetical protein